jgi:hypothetical protein
MANFVINQTASEIQQILNKAESPDTTPTPNSQNLVESGGVKTYVDTQVAAGASITTASFAPSALEDSTEGLTATDTAVPTSKAVFDAVDAASSKIASLTGPAGTVTVGTDAVVPFTITSDPSNIVSVSGGVITPAPNGVYQLILTGEFREDDSDTNDYYIVKLQVNTTTLASEIINEVGSSSSTYKSVNITGVTAVTGSETFRCFLNRVSNTSLSYRNVKLIVIKL